MLHTLTGLFIAAIVLPFMNRHRKSRLVQWWCGRLLAAFNIKVVASGKVPNSGLQLNKVMFVANHISWSDVHALNSIVPVRFIAKSEIRHWPIFGYLVRQANTLFIDRNLKKDAKRIMDAAVESLRNGDNLCFFPEGTTTNGTMILPFKSSLIQAALEAEALIWPIAIRYPDTQNNFNTGVAYAGETSLTESMLNILSQQQPVVHLHFLEPVAAETAAKLNRQALTQHIEHSIRQQLSL